MRWQRLGFTLLWQASGTINFAQGEVLSCCPHFMMLILLARRLAAGA
jgi:branched-subunit amino acid ABC-type transport system permease component